MNYSLMGLEKLAGNCSRSLAGKCKAMPLQNPSQKLTLADNGSSLGPVEPALAALLAIVRQVVVVVVVARSGDSSGADRSEFVARLGSTGCLNLKEMGDRLIYQNSHGLCRIRIRTRKSGKQLGFENFQTLLAVD
jgi:hypothetical protein